MAIVTIAGTAGSGKSTLAKLLAKTLNYKHHSVGDARRAIAAEKGITLQELNKLSEQGEFDSDTPVDEYMGALGKKEENLVIDCRTGFHFVQGSIKIFLDAKKEIRAERILHRKSLTERPKNMAEALTFLDGHKISEKKRYQKYYNIDIWDKSHYDFLLDSTSTKPDELVAQILEKFPELQQ
ncbi:AAA family ATPase [Candidatus Woesearchaeota archaeon]|nr:AAA family ATPase [Candidatus Woesearchaeota archaeon]